MKKNIVYIIWLVGFVLCFVSCKEGVNSNQELTDLGQDTITWTAPQKIDFAVQSLVLLGANQELLDSVIILPNEENSIIPDLKKASTEQLILCLVGYQGERLVDTINAKSGVLKVLFKQDYEVNTYEIAADIDFEYWTLNEDVMPFAPVLEGGESVIRFGWGLPIGNYQFSVAGNGKRSENYSLSKDNLIGYLEIKFDLSQLSSVGWDANYIVTALTNTYDSFKYDKTVSFLSYLKRHLKRKEFDRTALLKFLDEKKLQKIKTNLATLSRDSVSYLSNFMEVNMLIHELLTKIKILEKEKAIDTELQILALGLLEETSEKIEDLLAKESLAAFQQNGYHYFEELTDGHVTTSSIDKMIRMHFSLLRL